ncbi:hypothetical protein SADUNF_Sadunf19G0010700 [Salix dunnii]|uniref:Reverse transcriptase Ty1/copia-type domain-containing protein n=1 Tax=Salix dunnii TaxID=1413687 RepID=A0A835MC51_9ROSI|nr:hypothetical protein SADUNF_Sadunf19G0010700 [Salix dunnii]
MKNILGSVGADADADKIELLLSSENGHDQPATDTSSSSSHSATSPSSSGPPSSTSPASSSSNSPSPSQLISNTQPPITSPAIPPTHPMITRSKLGIFKPKTYMASILRNPNTAAYLTSTPESAQQALTIPTLGSVTYFLGFETTRGADGIHLSQTKYTIDLLKKTNMLEANPCPTPMNQSNKLHLQDSEPFEYITLYRSTIGALQYLTLSRPDIAFLVNKLSQFLQSPTQNHWQACKRILRYLAGSIGKGIQFTNTATLSIESFCDSDWASSLDDRKSTSGYCVYLGGNLISWSSRK